ncbi:MAG: periplasmic heavy metal sensor [Pseudomonadota bacterium]
MNEAAQKTRAPIGLIISIAINGLLIGLVIGMVLAGPRTRAAPPQEGRPNPPEQQIAEGVVRAAPFGMRRELRQSLRRAWIDARPDREALDQIRLDLAAALAAEPFDRAAVDEAFLAWREADMAVKEKIQTALADAMASLPPERRALIANALENPPRNRRRLRPNP